MESLQRVQGRSAELTVFTDVFSIHGRASHRHKVQFKPRTSKGCMVKVLRKVKFAPTFMDPFARVHMVKVFCKVKFAPMFKDPSMPSSKFMQDASC